MVEFATPTWKGRRGHLYQAAIRSFLIHAVDLRPRQIQAAEWYFALVLSSIGLMLIMLDVGIPLSELKPRVETGLPLLSKGYKRPNKLAEIRFIRNRMFYAKPDVNKHGRIQIGLKRISQ